MNDEQRERYLRHILLREIGGQGQKTLAAARVLLVGGGGLGAPILQYLAAAGVGTITLVDDDVVSLSNLQRQVIYQTADVGRRKVDAAKQFAQRLNPDVAVETVAGRLGADNAADLVSSHDLVVEGVDNFATRFVLNRACLDVKTPLVSAAIGRFNGQLTTLKPFAKPGVFPCYRCLVAEAPPRDEQANCAEEGVLGAVAGVIGSLAAVEAVKELLAFGDSLAGRLLLYDGLTATMRTIAFPADPRCPDCRPS